MNVVYCINWKCELENEKWGRWYSLHTNSAARTWRHEKSTPAEGQTNNLQTDKGMYGD